jgi:hypothetical protein
MKYLEEIQKAAGVLAPLDQWAKRCHEASLFLVESGVYKYARVARGTCQGVGGQHSWVVLDDNVYSETATIIDPTLWSYNPKVKGVWAGVRKTHTHRPFGAGSIWDFGRPPYPIGKIFELKPSKPFSRAAAQFLNVLGPLDEAGWVFLMHCPMEGWPSGEIISALAETKLRGRIPIDICGMVTNVNPQKLYLKS